jgi:hypothetical protein
MYVASALPYSSNDLADFEYSLRVTEIGSEKKNCGFDSGNFRF